MLLHDQALCPLLWYRAPTIQAFPCHSLSHQFFQDSLTSIGPVSLTDSQPPTQQTLYVRRGHARRREGYVHGLVHPHVFIQRLLIPSSSYHAASHGVEEHREGTKGHDFHHEGLQLAIASPFSVQELMYALSGAKGIHHDDIQVWSIDEWSMGVYWETEDPTITRVRPEDEERAWLFSPELPLYLRPHTYTCPQYTIPMVGSGSLGAESGDDARRCRSRFPYTSDGPF